MEIHKLVDDIKIRYMDLVSEVGELGKEIIKASDYGKKELEEFSFIKDEIGDAIFSLLALFCTFDISAENALQNSLEKYQTRFLKK